MAASQPLPGLEVVAHGYCGYLVGQDIDPLVEVLVGLGWPEARQGVEAVLDQGLGMRDRNARRNRDERESRSERPRLDRHSDPPP